MTEAAWRTVSAEAIVPSKSLASRRFRLIQAKQRDRAIAILDIGRAGLDHQGAAIAIDHGGTFVDFRFLAGVPGACRIWSVFDAKLKYVA